MAKKKFLKKALAFAFAATLILGAGFAAELCGADFAPLASLTADATEESGCNYTTENEQITITGYDNPAGNIVIPKVINGLPVTRISSGAFANCNLITSVSIPSTVKLIDYNAFSSCSSMVSVIFEERSEDQLLEISNWVFSGCTALSSINLEDSNVVSMGGGVFSGCTSLSKVVMPDTLSSVSGGTFKGCTNLNEVILSDNITTLSDFGANILGFFADCSSLTKIAIPDKVTDIGTDAFKNSALEEITFGQNSKLTRISSYAFAGTRLKSVIIPATVNFIDLSAFSDCELLETVMFETRVQDQFLELSDFTFAGCKKLTSINFEESNVISIGGGTFRNCEGLVDIVMPDTLVNVGGGTFYGCKKLSNVKLSKNMTALNDFGARMEGFFWACESLSEINIPNKIITIGYDAFSKSGLKKIDFEKNSRLTEISSQAFINSKLESITIPSTVVEIGRIAFQNTELEWVIFEGNKNLEIVNHAFDGCDKLTDVYYTGTEEEWNEIIINEIGNDYLLNAEMHFNYINIIKEEIVNSEFDVSASFDYGCYDEEVELRVKRVEKDREPGGIYIPDDRTLERVGCFDISIVKKGSDEYADKKTDGKVTVRMSIPKEFEGQKDFRMVHYFNKGGYENFSTEPTDKEGKITVDGNYLVFSVTEFSDFGFWAVVPAEQNDENNNVDNNVPAISSFQIREPSVETVSYGDSLVLHADFEGVIPEGGYIKWTADNEYFTITASADGEACTVSPEASGSTVFTATVYDADGTELAKDEQTLTAKAGIFVKIIAFFKKLFGLTKIIPEVLKTA